MDRWCFPPHLLRPISSGPELLLQMGSCVVASPFSTQFNRVMKWLPDSSGHAALRPPHSEGGPVKCRRSGWFPLMKYQYLHLHFQPAASVGFDQTWHDIDQIKVARLQAGGTFSTPVLSAPAKSLWQKCRDNNDVAGLPQFRLKHVVIMSLLRNYTKQQFMCDKKNGLYARI